MKSIQKVVPRMLVKHHLPHPEFYGESLVELLNGMATDVYTSKAGDLITITNNDKLIRYLKENDVKQPVYHLQDDSTQLVSATNMYRDLLLVWLNASTRSKYGGHRFTHDDIHLFLSHAVTRNGHLFIAQEEGLSCGLAGYTIINKTAVVDFVNHDRLVLAEQKEDVALKLLINHIHQLHEITTIKALVSKKDTPHQTLYKRNGFVEDGLSNDIEDSTIYLLSCSGMFLSENEKEILKEFFSLYPEKLFDLAHTDELIDLEHQINYALKSYSSLILTNQFDKLDELEYFYTDDDGLLSIEDNLVKKYDKMMRLLSGEDLKIAKQCRGLMIIDLGIINKYIKRYEE